MPSKAKAIKPKSVKIKIIEPVLVNSVPDISYSIVEETSAPPPSLDIEPIPCVCVEDNTELNVPALRKLCKERGIKGYSKLKKADLLNLLV